MRRYHIRHKITVGDITHLSDQDGERIISGQWHAEEDMIEVSSIDGIYLAQITFIDTASVEIEIMKKLEEISETLPEKENSDKHATLTIIQSLSNERKFDYFLEKAVELGVQRIIPVESEYSLFSAQKAEKLSNRWAEIIKNSLEQSRSKTLTTIDAPISMSALTARDFSRDTKICLSTEQLETKPITTLLTPRKNTIVAIGPEKGWSSKDLSYFEENGFLPASLGDNILRTETCGIVVATLFNYINGGYNEK